MFYPGHNPETTDEVIERLKTLRFSNRPTEKEVQRVIMNLLMARQISVHRELKLSPRNIVDFFLPNSGIVIEVKKGKPHSTAQVVKQIERYAAFDRVKAVIIIVGGKLHNPPAQTSNGKPVYYIGLAKLWGVAV